MLSGGRTASMSEIVTAPWCHCADRRGPRWYGWLLTSVKALVSEFKPCLIVLNGGYCTVEAQAVRQLRGHMREDGPRRLQMAPGTLGLGLPLAYCQAAELRWLIRRENTTALTPSAQ